MLETRAVLQGQIDSTWDACGGADVKSIKIKKLIRLKAWEFVI